MKIFQFDLSAAESIDQFGSNHTSIARVATIPGNATVQCIYFDPGGVVGYHPAVENQLFLVVQGKGWVRGDDEEVVAITTGQAVYWEAGEWHESKTSSGMTAIVIEGQGLDPSKYMPEASDL